MSDLELDRAYRKGDGGPKVKLIQEWLCLNGVHLSTDGAFGPATEAAVKAFQARAGLTQSGAVDPTTFERLIAPMTEALKPIPAANRPVGRMVVLYAQQHLRQSPREVGGQNRGPWVRLYMDGNEGEPWAWCAGFACFVLKQACSAVGAQTPLKPSFSCDLLAADAQSKHIFLAGKPDLDTQRLSPGCLFLSRRTATDWEHTGIVIGVDREAIETIEGNTNDDGSREGYEVCQRHRGLAKMDFVVIR